MWLNDDLQDTRFTGKVVLHGRDKRNGHGKRQQSSSLAPGIFWVWNVIDPPTGTAGATAVGWATWEEPRPVSTCATFQGCEN